MKNKDNGLPTRINGGNDPDTAAEPEMPDNKDNIIFSILRRIGTWFGDVSAGQIREGICESGNSIDVIRTDGSVSFGKGGQNDPLYRRGGFSDSDPMVFQTITAEDIRKMTGLAEETNKTLQKLCETEKEIYKELME